MEINIKNLEKLLNKEFNGNMTAMARAFHVCKEEVRYVFRTKKFGKIFISGVLEYCHKKNLKFDDYFIFLD